MTENINPGANEATGTFQVADRKLQAGDCHSLAELAVASEQTIKDSIGDAIEVGWTVDPALAGSHDPDLPHLFVFYWVNGRPGCYDTTCPGFHKVGSLVGSVLSESERDKPVFSIVYDGRDWDILDDDQLIGFYPASLWNGFTEFHLAVWFGEVAARPGTAATCTQMGNGKPGSNPDADTISDMTLHRNGRTLPPNIRTDNPTPDYYEAQNLPDGPETEIRFGGSGACSVP